MEGLISKLFLGVLALGSVANDGREDYTLLFSDFRDAQLDRELRPVLPPTDGLEGAFESRLPTQFCVAAHAL